MRWQTLRDTLRADLRPGTERGNLIRSAGATAGLKLGATLLAFGASLLYARVLGPHDYGLYAYVIAWAGVLTIPAGLGLPQYLVREGAKAPESLNGLRRWADSRIIISGLATALLMAGAIFVPYAADARWLFVAAAPIPLLNSLGQVRIGLLRARGWVARSQWPLLILGPGLMLTGLAALWGVSGKLHPLGVIIAMTATAAVPLTVNEFQLRRAARQPSEERAANTRLRAALPFMWLGMLYLLNNRTDLIMLGAFEGAHAAGIYSIAARVAALVTFFMATSNMVLAPRIARLHRDGDHALLQRLLTGATRRILALSLPTALVFIIAAQPLLGYIYGAKYVEGAIALQILAAAQLIHVAAGPTGTVLNMTGYEKLSGLGIGISLVINIILNAILIPLYGVEGAAVSTATSIIFWNALMWIWIRRHLQLRPSVFRC